MILSSNLKVIVRNHPVIRGSRSGGIKKGFNVRPLVLSHQQVEGFIWGTQLELFYTHLSTSLLTTLLRLFVLCLGSLNGPWRNLQFLPNWHLPSRSQFLHFSGGYGSLGLARWNHNHLFHECINTLIQSRFWHGNNLVCIQAIRKKSNILWSSSRYFGVKHPIVFRFADNLISPFKRFA